MMQIKTEVEADKAALRQIKVEAEIEKLEADKKKEVATINKKYGDKIKKLQEENKGLLEGLAEYYWANPEKRAGKTKLMPLATTQLSERETSSIAWPKGKEKVEAFIKKLKRLGEDFKAFIKTKEEIDKKKINEEASSEQLKAMGLKRETTTTVYAEQL